MGLTPERERERGESYRYSDASPSSQRARGGTAVPVRFVAVDVMKSPKLRSHKAISGNENPRIPMGELRGVKFEGHGMKTRQTGPIRRESAPIRRESTPRADIRTHARTSAHRALKYRHCSGSCTGLRATREQGSHGAGTAPVRFARFARIVPVQWCPRYPSDVSAQHHSQ